MAGIIYSANFATVASVGVQPAVNASYPSSRMIDREFPLRHCRTTSTAEQFFVFDHGSNFGTGTYGLVLFDTNYGTVEFASGTSATYNDASFNADNVSSTISQEPRTQRRNIFVSKSITTKRYVRLHIPAQTPTDGASYYQSGCFALATPYQILTTNPEALDVTVKANYWGEGRAKKRRSALWVEMDITGRFLSAEVSEWRAIAALGEDAPFLWYLNRGTTSEVWLMVYDGGGRFKETGVYVEAEFHLREFIGPEDL